LADGRGASREATHVVVTTGGTVTGTHLVPAAVSSATIKGKRLTRMSSRCSLGYKRLEVTALNRESAMVRSMHRRQVLLGSAALASQWGCMCSAWAQSTGTLTVPVIDRLTVKVLTDSSYDTPRPTSSPWVKVRRTGISASGDYRKTLHNEWGLALALESQAGNETRNYMLDFGYTVEALSNNMEIMGVDPSEVQALILSHGHFDHFGGLIGFLQRNRAKLPAALTLYAGGEDNFCRRVAAGGTPGQFAESGVLDRRELDALKVRVVLCPVPTVIADQAFTTGVIERKSFERVLPNTLVDYSMKDGLGCNIPAAAEKAQGKPVPDVHLNEHATCFHLKDRGLIVISSCGHTGIVNTTRQAMKVSGVDKVHAILGGFHLFPADDAYLSQTVAELKTLNPDVLIPMHCSGPGLLASLRSLMPERLVPSTNGTEYTFGA
jgi:7,8-dihydropterin-6-yl-methyl-4-(beta-D-ribofuranosyl)aminobenzene 5'-phosphate synthase